MSWGTLRVRNVCPFPVTFYALAGPTLEIAAGSTASARACLIWFSTRVKGGGDVINLGTFESLRDDYAQQLANDGHDVADYEDGGSGAAAGSILGLAVGALEGVFKVKNTRQGNNLYFGAKKEGVYGNSNLVVYATLDKACLLDPKLDRIWFLHLEADHGQRPTIDPDPEYTVPNLAQYADTFFVRARNKYYGTYLYAKIGDTAVGVRSADIPYNPLTMREYWSVHPLGNGDAVHNVKVLNTASNKWLTCYTSDHNRIGLYPVGYTDYPDQHWNLAETSSEPETVKLENLAMTGYNLVASSSDGTFIYHNIDTSTDQQWLVETCTVDVHNIPAEKPFRIMQAATGKFICGVSDGTVSLVSIASSMEGVEEAMGVLDSHFVLEASTSGDYRIKSVRFNKYLTFYGNEGRLGLYIPNGGDYKDQHWKFELADNYAGFFLVNQSDAAGPYNHLYHNGKKFGLYFGTSPDQYWVAVV